MAFRGIKGALETGLRLIAARLSENMTSRGSVASGELNESIGVTVPQSRGGTWSAGILMNDYWEFVDQGRKPGKMPPIASILEWLKHPTVQDSFTFGRGNISDQTALPSIAYNIAKKIGREGTRGTNFATDVFDSDLVDDIGGLVQNAIAEDFDQTIKEIQDLIDS